MLNSVKNGITKALHTQFPTLDVFTEEVGQGLTPPCFIVTMISPAMDNVSLNMIQFDETFMIQYFPKDTKKKFAEMYDIIDTLNDCLDVITVKVGSNTKKTRRLKMESEIVDNVLNVKVRYADQYLIKTTGDDMTAIKTTISEKG